MSERERACSPFQCRADTHCLISLSKRAGRHAVCSPGSGAVVPGSLRVNLLFLIRLFEVGQLSMLSPTPQLEISSRNKICPNRLDVFLLVPPDHDDIS